MPASDSDAIPLPTPPHRIIVTGTTGSGKTTLARELSARLAIPNVELDALFWGPNWTETPSEVLRKRIAEATKGDEWIVDGNYSSARGSLWSRATTIIWLDYPLRVIMRQLFWRTLYLTFTRQELWSGNKESFRNAFLSRNSILLFALKTHSRRRRAIGEALKQPEVSDVNIVRLRSPKVMRRWLQTIASRKSVK
ncbi:MAG: adenylate kinase [Chloroflexi bacterium]|nr:adenylate kinase [Chloroflexota bacterium]